MALKLENEFVVAAALETTWTMLLDLSRVSQCLPGATVEPSGEEGVYRGTMRVKLGPVTVDYAGTARLTDVDAAGRSVVVLVEGRETRGQGTASARMTSRLTPDGNSTRVAVDTELNVTGRPAQFGRGIMQDISARILNEFAVRLSALLQETPAAPPPASTSSHAPGPPDTPPPPTPAPRVVPPPGGATPQPPPPGPAPSAGPAPASSTALDLTDAVRGALAGRARTAAAVGVSLLVAATVLRRLRRR